MPLYLKRSKPLFIVIVLAGAALALMMPAIIPGSRRVVISICSRTGVDLSRFT